MGIGWQEDLATGLEGIDNQHREIFARFSLFSAACTDGQAGEEMLRLLAFLADYTAVHFREEEQAMADAEYPQLAEQEKAHVGFLAEFARLRRLVEEKEPSLEAILNGKRTMVRWLINHISHMDRAFAGFLAAERD